MATQVVRVSKCYNAVSLRGPRAAVPTPRKAPKESTSAEQKEGRKSSNKPPYPHPLPARLSLKENQGKTIRDVLR